MDKSSLARSFDRNAELYAKMRPGYPEKLFEAIFAAKNINADSRVLEIGIGAGQASTPFLQTGASLLAVDIGENFIAQCREKFSDYANFSAVTARFEDMPAEPASFDLIYSASAFHWIEEAVGYRRVYELLATGGVFARFAHRPGIDPAQLDLHEAIQEQYKIYMHSSNSPRPFNAEDAEVLRRIPEKYGFSDTQAMLFTRTRRFSPSEYTALLSTYSDHMALPENTRREFFAAIEECIRRYGGELRISDVIDLELARKEQ